MSRTPLSTPTITFDSELDGAWTATLQTASGPVTAVGDSMGEAQRALQELLLIQRALEVTRRTNDMR